MTMIAELLNPHFNARQRAMALLIEAQFTAAGWPAAVAAGAIVNAWAESRLNPEAVNGNQVGLFQVDHVQGAGVGHTAEQLRVPATNIAVILGVLRRHAGDQIRQGVAAGEQRPAWFAHRFCVDVERPKDKEKVGLYREGLTYSVFPGLVSAAERDIGVGGAIAASMVGTDKQRQMAALIEDRFAEAGLPGPIIVGAITNALAESGLNPLAMARESNGSVSAGLFQLNDGARSAGAGMTLAQRQDPRQNIARMIAVYRGGAGRVLEEAYAHGERDPGLFAALWCVYLERPADAQTRAVERRALAYRRFPHSVQLARLSAAPQLPDRPGSSGGAGLLVGTLLGLATVGVALAARARRS